MRRGLHNL
jgi:vacuolar protein sorting-associated protein 29